jgi:hypothetical protein
MAFDPLDPLAPPQVPTPPPPAAPTPPTTTTGLATPWIGSQPRVNDSMAAQVAALTSADSKLNQMAQTEGLKAANRRGLLNSSMAVGAAQDAVLKNVMPIAAQDATQAYGQNQAARAFEYGMTGQESQQGFESAEAKALREWQTSEAMAGRNWQTGERLGTETFQAAQSELQRGWQTAERLGAQGFAGTQEELNRDLQMLMQSNQITSAESMHYAQIASTQGIEAANRQLSRDLQEKDITFRMEEGQLTRDAAVAAQNRDIAFQTSESMLNRNFQISEAGLNRNLQEMLQRNQITNEQFLQANQIAATGDIEGAARQLQRDLQENDIDFRMEEGNLTRAAAVYAQEKDQEFQRGENFDARGWQTAENLAARDFQGTQQQAERDLQLTLQDGQIRATDALALRQILATGDIERFNRELSERLQANDIDFRMTEGNLTREQALTMQANEQAFARGENVMARDWQSAEAIRQRDWQEDQAGFDRTLQELLQANQIDEAERAQIAAITSAEYMQERGLTVEQAIAQASNTLQETLQERDINFRMGEGQLTREAAEQAQKLDIMFQQTEGALDRQQQLRMQDLDIQFRMREGNLTREAAAAAQEADINYRMTAGNLDRASAERMQAAEIKANTQVAALDRATQEKIASWNLSATNKGNLAQMITDVERTYAAKYDSIMSNTNLSAAARTAQLTSIKQARNVGLSLAEQTYSTNLTW